MTGSACSCQHSALLAALMMSFAACAAKVQYNGMPLQQLPTQGLTNDQPLDADLMATTARSGSRKAIEEGSRSFLEWCAANGGGWGTNPLTTPHTAKFYEAVNEHAASHRLPGSGTFVVATYCVGQEGALIGAMVNHRWVRLAYYDRPAAEAFVARFGPAAKQREREAGAAQDRKREEKQRSFQQAVVELDGKREPGLATVALASDSIAFIREKIDQDTYGTSGTFLTEPCEFNAFDRGDLTAPRTIDLRSLNLSDLQAGEQRPIQSADGQVQQAYGIKLRSSTGSAFVEFTSMDVAQRTARAFQSLAQRCGAKRDDRFR